MFGFSCLAETVFHKEIFVLNNKGDNSSKKGVYKTLALVFWLSCEMLLKRECTISARSSSLVSRVLVITLVFCFSLSTGNSSFYQETFCWSDEWNVHRDYKRSPGQGMRAKINTQWHTLNPQPDDQDPTIRTTNTPGFKPFTVKTSCLYQKLYRTVKEVCNILLRDGRGLVLKIVRAREPLGLQISALDWLLHTRVHIRPANTLVRFQCGVVLVISEA